MFPQLHLVSFFLEGEGVGGGWVVEAGMSGNGNKVGGSHRQRTIEIIQLLKQNVG